jgi:hypothetical protein
MRTEEKKEGLAHVQILDSRLRGNDVMPVETGIQKGGGLPLATWA